MRESLRKAVQRAHHSRADVIVGKKGVTPEVVEEIKRRLEQKEVIKVKILRTGVETEGIDRREIARLVAQAAGARLMGVRGRTFVLYKPRPKRERGGMGIAFKETRAFTRRGGRRWSRP